MAGNAQLAFAIRALNESSKTLKEIQGDLDTTGKKAEQAGKQTGGFGKILGDVGKIAAGFLAANVISKGVGELTNLVGGSINAAKDLGESLNAVNVVFGKSGQKILDWGKSNATAFGLSSREFNQLVTPLGAMLTNYGFSADVAADKSIELAKRAADMASVFNVDVGEALGAIQAGLRGEADPLEKFGVGLNAAAVESKALAMSGKSVAKELTDQEKKAASLALIMQQTDKVAGDFAKTSDDLANKTRINAAKQEELQAVLGQKLLPVSLAITNAKLKLAEVFVNSVVPAAEAVGRVVSEKLSPILKDGAEIVETKVIPALESSIPWFKDLGETALTIGKDILQQYLIPAVATLSQGWSDLQPILKTLLDDVLKPVWKILSDHKEIIIVLAATILLLTNPWLAVIAVLVLVLAKWDEIKVLFTETIPQAIDSVITKIKELPVIGEIFQAAWETARTIVETAFKLIANYVETGMKVIKDIITIVTALIHGDWDKAWQGVKQLVSDVFVGIKNDIEIKLGAVVQLFTDLPPRLLAALGDLLTLLVTKGDDLIKGLAIGAEKALLSLLIFFNYTLPTRIGNEMLHAGEWLFGTGKAIVRGLIDGVEDMIGDLIGVFSKITNLIPSWKGPEAKDRALLRPAGRWIMEGLIEGLTSQQSELLKAVAVINRALGSAADDETRMRLRARLDLMLKDLREVTAEMLKVGGGISPSPGGGGGVIPPGGGGGISPLPAAGTIASNILSFNEAQALSGLTGIPIAQFSKLAMERLALLLNQQGAGSVLPFLQAYEASHASLFSTQALLSDLRKYGLSFHQGGVVPGPIGSEQIVVARGGERFLGPGQGGVTIVVNVNAIDGESVRRIAPQLAREIQRHLRSQGAVGMIA